MDKREIRFDGWHIDFQAGEITRDGTTHRLQDQPLQILETLSERPGEVVTREHLIARLWPRGVVEFDTGLNSAVRKLRMALGDDAETPRYIETLPRKGYRFIAKLEEPEPEATASPGLPEPFVPTFYETGEVIGRRAEDRKAPLQRLAWGLGAVLAAAVLAVIAWRMPGRLFQPGTAADVRPTIVVLPLVDMSGEQNQQPLCDGLTEELSNWLAQIPTLRVVARTSAFAFKDKNEDVRTIGTQLGATHVLEGSLRRSGDQVRVTVQLIDAANGIHVWSRHFDKQMGDIFAIEDEVSRQVAEALHLELTSGTAEQWAQRQPEKMEAYELYLLGRARQRKRTPDDNVKAIEFLRRSMEADPQYALAPVALAETLLNGLAISRAPLEDVTAEAEPLINRALTLSPNLSDALAAKGWLLTEQFKFDEALPLLTRAAAANPNDASSQRLLGNLYDRRGEPATALEHFSRSADLDPLDANNHVFRCMELVDVGEFAAAEAACARARELDPTYLWGPLATSWIARAQGDPAGALRWIKTARELAPGNEFLVDQQIELELSLGNVEGARAAMRELPAGGFFALARAANLEYAAGGAAALRQWFAQHEAEKQAQTGAELAELARLQSMAQDPAAARATLARAERILPLSSADLFDGSQIRHEYSNAVVQAGIELNGGDRQRALALLARLDAMLDNYEKHGGRHFGLYVLRAESLAMQGRKADAEAAMRDAWAHGWRSTWRARRDQWLSPLAIPK